VVGADLAQCYGGAVVLADLIAGHSITATTKKVGRR
jgi:bifunctional ADP-heptose synthase (sugar kinase/adenylyltransferase)